MDEPAARLRREHTRGVTRTEIPGCLSSSSSSSSSSSGIEFEDEDRFAEDDDEDDQKPSLQLEVIGKPAARGAGTNKGITVFLESVDDYGDDYGGRLLLRSPRNP